MDATIDDESKYTRIGKAPAESGQLAPLCSTQQESKLTLYLLPMPAHTRHTKNHDHVSLTTRSSLKCAPLRVQQPLPWLHCQQPSLPVGADLTLAGKSDTHLHQSDLHLPQVTSREEPGHLGG